MVYETLGRNVCGVVLSAALTNVAEFAGCPSDADPDVSSQAKRLIWVRSLKSLDRPRLKQSTIERLSLSSSILQSWLAVCRTLGGFDLRVFFHKCLDSNTERHLWEIRIYLPPFGRRYLNQSRVERHWGRPKQSRRTSPLLASTRKTST